MRLLADESLNNDILRALLQENLALDIIRVQDTQVFHADDPTVLEWAAQEQRIVITHDVRTMPKYLFDRVAKSLPAPGIIEIKRGVPIKAVVEDLLILIEAGTPADFENQVRYIPL